LRLIYSKVTSRSYGYFFKFSYLNFLRNRFIQLCQKLQSLEKKTQGILGVKGEEKAFFVRVPRLLSMFWNPIEMRWIGLRYAKV
jgi:hypothetical protein